MTKQLNILIISVRADYGGGPQHIYSLMSNLSQSVKIFAAVPEDIPYYNKYLLLVGKERLKKIPHRRFRISVVFQLVQFIKRNNIDLIHSHGKGAGIYSRVLGLLTGKPVVHTFHGLHIDKYNKPGAGLYIALERILSYFTSRLISVSNSELKRIKELKIASSDKVVLIENGVLIPEEFVREQVLDKRPFKILTITRFDYAKNSGLLIPIVEKLIASELNDFVIVVIGTGEEEADLKKMIHSKKLDNYFLFAGVTDNILEYYRDSFCYLSTSKWEGLPLSVMESIASGVPVIASDVPGNNDLIEDNITGYLYPLNNPEKAAQLIRRIALNKNEWSAISTAGRNKIKQNYSILKMAEQTERLYFSVINQEIKH